jgi:hypothetical protein
VLLLLPLFLCPLFCVQMRVGLAKKDVPPAAVSRRLAAAAALHEWLLFLLNCVNVGASLLLPCGMVLCNKVRTVHVALLLTLDLA